MTIKGVLKHPPPRETDKERTKYPFSEGSKRTTGGQKQIGQLGCYDIGGDNIGRMES